MTGGFRASARRAAGLDPLWMIRRRGADRACGADRARIWMGYDFGGGDSVGVMVLDAPSTATESEGEAVGVIVEPVREAGRERAPCLAPKPAPVIDWADVSRTIARQGIARPDNRRPVVTEETPLPDAPPRKVVEKRAGTNRAAVNWAGTRWCSQCDMRITSSEANGCASRFCKAPRS